MKSNRYGLHYYSFSKDGSLFKSDIEFWPFNMNTGVSPVYTFIVGGTL